MSYLTRFLALGNTYTIPISDQRFNDNFGETQTAFVRVPGEDGALDHYGIERAPTGLGTVTASFMLYSDAKPGMEALRDDAMAMIDWGRGLLYQQPSVLSDNERFVIARASTVTFPKGVGAMIDTVQQVNVTFECPRPFWTAGGGGALWGTAVWGQFTWGGTGGAGLGGSGDPELCAGTQTDFIRENAGKATTVPVITVDVASGESVTTIKIQRIVDGAVVDEFNYPLALAALDKLVIDPSRLSIKKNGSDAYNAAITTLRGRWYELPPGDSSIRVVQGNAGDESTVTLNYDTRYRQ